MVGDGALREQTGRYRQIIEGYGLEEWIHTSIYYPVIRLGDDYPVEIGIAQSPVGSRLESISWLSPPV